jgi:hypothetical protein
MTIADDDLIGPFEMIDALEAVIKDSNPEKRAALRDTIEAWAIGAMANDFFWATSSQAPALLRDLMMAIDVAASGEGKPKSRVIHLASRKPEGSA